LRITREVDGRHDLIVVPTTGLELCRDTRNEVIKFNKTLTNNNIPMAGNRNIHCQVEKGTQSTASVANVIGSSSTTIDTPTRRRMSTKHRQNLSKSMKEWARRRKAQAGQ
jgi:hypothetical protein